MGLNVALCISGLSRLNDSALTTRTVRDIEKKMKAAAVFYHTWDGYQIGVPREFHEELLTTPEPIVNYDPVLDPDPSINQKQVDYRRLKQSGPLAKHRHANKQIIAHANIVEHNWEYLKGCDVIVRARWDSVLANNVNWDEWLTIAADLGPVGFMTRSKDNFGKIWVREKTKECNDWCEYLPDILIMHSPKHCNPQDAYNLFEAKQLRSAEWGWWQVLSAPYGGDIHTSIRGVARSSDGHGRRFNYAKLSGLG